MQMKQRSKKTVVTALVLAFLLMFGQFTVLAAPAVPTRKDAPESTKWDLTQIYKTPADFKAEIKAVEKNIKKITAMKGKLNNQKNIREFFNLVKATSRKVDTITVYGYFNQSLDQSNSEAQGLNSLAEDITRKFSSAKSFADPELLKLSTLTLKTLMYDKKNADLKLYFESLLKTKAHTLSGPEEKLLSESASMATLPNTLYDMVTTADAEDPIIKGADGKDLKVTYGVYSRMLEDNNREMRKAVYEAQFGMYKKVNNTLGTNYAGQIKADIFYSKARKYTSSLDAALQAEHIDKKIYNNLITAVNNNLDPLHKYFDLKKKYLKVDNLHIYDIYKPLVTNFNMSYTFDESNTMIKKALAPLGTEYVNKFQEAIDNRWMDVYEDENKESGAYQWGSYDTHPYVLLNFNGSLDAALTTAHEMGHAMNSYYSNKKQDYMTSNYPIFTAEVASTTNEMLVMDYLIKNAKSDDEKLYLINQQIENIKGSLYQQVMYSEFEQAAHKLMESGEPGTAEAFNKIWEDTILKYYGKSFVADDFTKYGWSRIPHFYTSFYVYKYATSMSAAYSLSKTIATGDQTAIKKYMNFLAAGASKYPVEVLKDAGVDMSKTKAVDDTLAYFSSLVDEMDKLLAAKAAK